SDVELVLLAALEDDALDGPDAALVPVVCEPLAAVEGPGAFDSLIPQATPTSAHRHATPSPTFMPKEEVSRARRSGSIFSQALQNLEKIGEGLRDTTRVQDLDAGRHEADHGEAHRHAMVVVRVHLRRTGNAGVYDEPVALFFRANAEPVQLG